MERVFRVTKFVPAMDVEYEIVIDTDNLSNENKEFLEDDPMNFVGKFMSTHDVSEFEYDRYQYGEEVISEFEEI